MSGELKEAVLKLGVILSDVINEITAEDDKTMDNLKKLQSCLKNHLSHIDSILIGDY